MKRFFLSFLIFAVSVGMFAQKGKVASALNFIEAGNLDKAKEAIDRAEVNEKTKDWGRTYYAKARLAQASYESTDAKMKKLFTDPLLVAYENYLKAIKLDDKGSIEKLVTLQVGQLGNDFLVWAGEEFDAENYDKSLAAFETLIDLQQKDFYISTLDTVLLFNAGIVSINAKQYDKAINYFNRCIEMGHGEAAPYEYLNSIYITLGDNENAERVLVEAFEKYPEAQNVLLSLIQFYLVNEMDQEAFSYIQKAMAADPGNYRLFWAEGVLYMKQDKLEEATVALGKSIEIEPDFFDTQYNMGVCYYNMGVNMFDKANEIMDNAKYNAAVEEAKKVFAKAIPYMERALELKDDDLDTMKSLKELYYRLQMTDKYNAIVSRIEEIEG
ncbi:MAG: tetratricopeptide repeat protein [Bacteroidales bacterium]